MTIQGIAAHDIEKDDWGIMIVWEMTNSFATCKWCGKTYPSSKVNIYIYDNKIEIICDDCVSETPPAQKDE